MYIIRWLMVMYNRKVYRKSREFMIEKQCDRKIKQYRAKLGLK